MFYNHSHTHRCHWSSVKDRTSWKTLAQGDLAGKKGELRWCPAQLSWAAALPGFSLPSLWCPWDRDLASAASALPLWSLHGRLLNGGEACCTSVFSPCPLLSGGGFGAVLSLLAVAPPSLNGLRLLLGQFLRLKYIQSSLGRGEGGIGRGRGTK